MKLSFFMILLYSFHLAQSQPLIRPLTQIDDLIRDIDLAINISTTLYDSPDIIENVYSNLYSVKSIRKYNYHHRNSTLNPYSRYSIGTQLILNSRYNQSLDFNVNDLLDYEDDKNWNKWLDEVIYRFIHPDFQITIPRKKIKKVQTLLMPIKVIKNHLPCRN